MPSGPRRAGSALAALNVLSAGLLTLRASGHAGFFTLPGATALFMSAIGLLLMYFATMVGSMRWLRRVPDASMHRALWLGVLAGAVICAHLGIERWVTLPRAWSGAVASGSMLLMFSLWGIAAFGARRARLSFLDSVALAVWSAGVTMSLAVGFGIALELFLAPVAPESMRSWAEFQRTGWSDLPAFAIANTMDSAISHLLGGPVVALIFGLVGVLAAERRALSATKLG